MSFILNYFLWKQIGEMLKSKTVKLTPEENEELFLSDMKTALFNKNVSQERTGTHVSDLTGCMRKKVYEKIDPTTPTNNQLMYFTTGSAVHGVLQDLTQHLNLDKYDIEKEVKYDKDVLQAHIDLYNKEIHMPVEIKTARMTSDMLISYGANDTYLLQLAMYLALTNTEHGLIEYILLSQKVEGFYHGFKMTLTEEERKIVLKEAVKRAKLLALAKEMEDPEMVEAVYEDKNSNYMCKECPYANELQCSGGNLVKLEMIRKKQERDSSIVRKPSKKAIEVKV